jgi:Domain of unknown function (DUF4440)
MLRSFALAAVAVLVFRTVVVGPSQEISALDRAWLIQSYRTHDMAAYDRIVAEEFTITQSDGSVLNKAEKRADILRSQLVAPSDPFAIVASRVRVIGDVAVSIGSITEPPDEVRFTNTYVRRAGVWQVVASQLTRRRARS